MAPWPHRRAKMSPGPRRNEPGQSLKPPLKRALHQGLFRLLTATMPTGIQFCAMVPSPGRLGSLKVACINIGHSFLPITKTAHQPCIPVFFRWIMLSLSAISAFPQLAGCRFRLRMTVLLSPLSQLLAPGLTARSWMGQSLMALAIRKELRDRALSAEGGTG